MIDAQAARDRAHLLLVGTHRRAHRADPADTAFGIYGFLEDDATGVLSASGMAETIAPGWIAAHPHINVAYAVNETRSDEAGVSAFAIDTCSGQLTPLNQRPTPPMPCFCATEAEGRFLFVATFGGGSVHMFELMADGSIGDEVDRHVHSGSSIHPRRQTEPHAHACVVDPSNRFLLVPDLGMDKLLVYRLDPQNRRLVPLPDRTVALPPLSGPRHIAFAADGRFAYLINEMSAAITAFGFDSDAGALSELQSIELLPEPFDGLRSGAAILLDPGSRHLYATTRSHGSSGLPDKPGKDLVFWFAVDPVSGRLTPRGSIAAGGGIPRSAAISPSGKHLLVAHQCNSTISIFEIDPDSGAPGAVVQCVKTPVPVCLTFVTPR